jgi:hypothetical protein
MNKPPKRLSDQVRELCAPNERSEPRIERDKCAAKNMALFSCITSWGYSVELEIKEIPDNINQI